MRVTLINSVADTSGGTRVIHIYAKLLREKGHEVSVVSRPRPLSFRKRVRSFLTGQGWPGPVSVASHFDPSCYNFRLTDHRRPIAPNDVPDADVIIATWWETAEWIAKFPPSKGRKIHFVQHYEAFEDMPKDRVDAALRLPMFKITISKWLDDMLRNQFGNTHVALVPNSVDISQFYASPRGKQARPTVGTLYSEVDWKDLRTGLRAFDLLKRKIPDVQFVTFGRTTSRLSLPLPVGTRHTVLPAQDRLRDIYASCDAWFCSSKAEGFGLPVLEAMACRCPVVSTVVGGPMDFVRNGVNGFLVPIEDPQALADRMYEILTLSDTAWRAMSDAACETAVSYSWADAGDLFEAALFQALNIHSDASKGLP